MISLWSWRGEIASPTGPSVYGGGFSYMGSRSLYRDGAEFMARLCNQTKTLPFPNKLISARAANAESGTDALIWIDVPNLASIQAASSRFIIDLKFFLYKKLFLVLPDILC